MGKRLGIALGVVGLIGLWVAPAGASKPQPRVLVYGDSLIKEASSTIVADGGLVKVAGTAGTSPCDYLKKAQKAFAKKGAHYQTFVVESAGNSNTTCMRDPSNPKHDLAIGSAAWLAKYRADLNTLADFVASKGTAMLFVSPPPFNGAAAPRNAVFDTVEAQLHADRPEVMFTDAPRLAVSNNGTFTETLPCLPSEKAQDGCSDGSIDVRAPDGIHFCPTGFSNKIKVTGCSVYDGGGVRFGQAIAAAIDG